jgi:hypothetical protein
MITSCSRLLYCELFFFIMCVMRGSSWMINCTLFMHGRATTVTETVETTRKRERKRK